VLLAPLRQLSQLGPREQPALLRPFVSGGDLDAALVIGSPEPHGPLLARAQDAFAALDLALFLGSFCTVPPEGKVVRDTDLVNVKQNLIVVGGPVVNKITQRVQTYLPIRFDSESLTHSELSERTYTREGVGTVQLIRNPWSKSHSILVLAGRRWLGTQAAIFACTRRLDRLSKGNAVRKSVLAHVVEGADRDSDGRLDWVDVLE
ncbi:MAG: hypothetical protein HC945_00595, partial [Nitrosarchaeum sp.]|nr:hypothetical protein [Nitrosarchaeum sp.]